MLDMRTVERPKTGHLDHKTGRWSQCDRLWVSMHGAPMRVRVRQAIDADAWTVLDRAAARDFQYRPENNHAAPPYTWIIDDSTSCDVTWTRVGDFILELRRYTRMGSTEALSFVSVISRSLMTWRLLWRTQHQPDNFGELYGIVAGLRLATGRPIVVERYRTDGKL